MANRARRLITVAVVWWIAALAHAQTAIPCPGYNPVNNTNLACEIVTAIRSSGPNAPETLKLVGPTLAAQLSQLPSTTAISGSSVTLGLYGLPTQSVESLGTILTQRGETIGRHALFASFAYQHFGFDSVDGIRFDNLQTVFQPAGTSPGSPYLYIKTKLDLSVDQFTFIGTFGLSKRMDLSLVVPFARVALTTTVSPDTYFVDSAGNFLFKTHVPNPISSDPNAPLAVPGSKTGPGDVTIILKGNFYTSSSEKTSIAVGGEIRLPTGDELNFLGTGAYGIKPYLVISHRTSRITPNVNIGYQWSGKSALYTDSTGTKEMNLPSSFRYSAGADVRLNKRLTVVGELLGQYVINGPRLRYNPAATSSNTFPTVTGLPANLPTGTIESFTGSYTIHNVGVGAKANPFQGLVIAGNILFELDQGGMRSRYVPLVSVSYRF